MPMPRSGRHQVTVLLDDPDEERFSAYCTQRGFKKSTLIVRLIREHLDREGFATQGSLDLSSPQIAKVGQRRPRNTRQ
jgi:hypothetical protein